MNKNIFLIVIIMFHLKCWGQNPINLNAQLYDFSTINKDNIKRTDFRFIDKYIEHKKIILLGEEHHKISEFNYLKSNLIEYLINEKRYEILLFENSIGETFYGLADKTKKLEITTILKEKLITPVWGVEENANLFKLIINQQNKIITGGVDPQIHTTIKGNNTNSFSEKILEQYFLSETEKQNLFVLDSCICKLCNNIIKHIQINKRALVRFEKADIVDMEKNMLLLKQCYINYKKIVNSCIPKFKNKEEKLFGLALKNRLIFGEMIISLQSDKTSDRYDYLRDSMMAYNLMYLADSIYPNKKIIVWAHDFHIAKSPVNKNNYKSSIGMFLKSDFNEKCYVIGLEMNGKYSVDGNLTNRSKKKNENTLHGDLSKLGDAFFLDFKEAISQKSIKSNYKYYSNFYYNSHSKQMETQILKNKTSTLNIFDAVFFIEITHPSHFYNIFGYTQLD